MRNDVLPKVGCFVLNMDTNDGFGTHWVAIFGSEYYDSFGLPPPETLRKQIKWYNTMQHQEMNSTLCGVYCCFYMWQRSRGNSRYDVCYTMLKQRGNKKWILQWLRHIA